MNLSTATGPCMVSIVTLHVCFLNPEKYQQYAEQCRGKIVLQYCVQRHWKINRPSHCLLFAALNPCFTFVLQSRILL